MNNCIFTICAKNYIGLAEVLKQSIINNNKDIDFIIFVADEIDSDDYSINNISNIYIAKDVLDITQEKWNEMSFKYDLTEFCTSIKPLCFKYIFKNLKYSKCIYLDPDILVYNSLDFIYDTLNSKSIILTPHIVNIEEKYTGDLKENGFLSTGVFNLGFLALKNNIETFSMLRWWANRLENECYRDVIESYFTDQKWMNFIPCFFDEENIHISKHLGLNLAPWNFFERELNDINGDLYVKYRSKKDNNVSYPLVFVHYSGFDYSSLRLGEIKQGNIQGLSINEDLKPIFKIYSEKIINSNFHKFSSLKYTYNYFNNNVPINIVYRRLYRRLHKDNKIKTNPFDTSIPNGLYNLLLLKKIINKDSSIVDKSTKYNVSNIDKKLKWINKFSIILFKLLGVNKYFLLVKLLRSYSRIENQVHLIDKEYLNKNILE